MHCSDLLHVLGGAAGPADVQDPPPSLRDREGRRGALCHAGQLRDVLPRHRHLAPPGMTLGL